MIIQIDRASKKVLVKRVAKKTAATPKTYVVIDYPQNGDQILPHHYSVRIGATPGCQVEISIDGGEWQPTRENCGYFWYDWHQIPEGEHRCVARIVLPDGKIKKSKIVTCRV